MSDAKAEEAAAASVENEEVEEENADVSEKIHPEEGAKENEADESNIADATAGVSDESATAIAQDESVAEEAETTGEMAPGVSMECESDTQAVEGESMTERVRRRIAAKSKGEAGEEEESPIKTPDQSPKKRKRGRPRKSEVVETETEGEEADVVPLRTSSRRSAQFATRRMKKFVKDLRRGDVEEISDDADGDFDEEDADFDPQSVRQRDVTLISLAKL